VTTGFDARRVARASARARRRVDRGDARVATERATRGDERRAIDAPAGIGEIKRSDRR